MTTRIAPRTVVEALLPFEGSVGLAVIYDTANRAGIEDQPVRLALRRMIASGDITQRGRGRAGSISLTEQGRDRLERDRRALHLAFAHDAGYEPWDGSWHLMAISAPEHERGIRDAFRRELLAAGAAPVSTGLYASPHDLAAYVAPGAMPYLVTAVATDLTVHGLSAPRDVAETLWPAQATIDGYSALTTAIDGDDPSAGSLVRLLRLADALEQALRNDPLLPPQLRPDPWLPAELRREWVQLWFAADATVQGPRVYDGWLPRWVV